MNGDCCRATETRQESPPERRRGRELATGAVALGIWVLMPKCPLCVATHIALWTGFGLSFTQAAYLRWSLLAVSGGALCYIVTKRAARMRSKPTTQSFLPAL